MADHHIPAVGHCHQNQAQYKSKVYTFTIFIFFVFRSHRLLEISCLEIKVSIVFFIVWACESRSVVSDSLWPHGLYNPWNSLGQNTGVGSCFLLQGIFPIQGSSPGLLHCRQILYQLSHKASRRILEWVAYPFSSGSSWPRNRTGVPALQVDSLPTGLSGKPMWAQWHLCDMRFWHQVFLSLIEKHEIG